MTIKEKYRLKKFADELNLEFDPTNLTPDTETRGWIPETWNSVSGSFNATRNSAKKKWKENQSSFNIGSNILKDYGNVYIGKPIKEFPGKILNKAKSVYNDGKGKLSNLGGYFWRNEVVKTPKQKALNDLEKISLRNLSLPLGSPELEEGKALAENYKRLLNSKAFDKNATPEEQARALLAFKTNGRFLINQNKPKVTPQSVLNNFSTELSKNNKNLDSNKKDILNILSDIKKSTTAKPTVEKATDVKPTTAKPTVEAAKNDKGFMNWIKDNWDELSPEAKRALKIGGGAAAGVAGVYGLYKIITAIMNSGSNSGSKKRKRRVVEEYDDEE